MNCEQVEELLSACLDDSLALGETAESASELESQIAAHLQDCIHCSTVLADYRRFDALLEQMPRVEPGPALREESFLRLSTLNSRVHTMVPEWIKISTLQSPITMCDGIRQVVHNW